MKYAREWRTQRLKYNSYIKGRVGWENLRADEFTESGPYLVTGMHFKDGEVDWNACYHVSKERYSVAPEIQLRPTDLLITKDGTIGKLAHIVELPGPACLNSHLLVIRPLRDAYVPRFMYYLLSSSVFDEFILQRQSGTTFFGLTQGAIENFPALLPPLELQREISRFLDREIAKIERLIEKQCDLLVAIEEFHQAQVTTAITACAAERIRLGAGSSVIEAHLPSGWSAPTVRRLIAMRRIVVQDGNHGELHPTASDYVKDGIPFIMASDLHGGEIDLIGCKFISEERARALRIGFSRPLDILVSHKGTLGAVAMVPEHLTVPFLMLTPQVTYYRVMDRSILPGYLYHMFSSQLMQQQLEYLAAGQATRAYVGLLAQRDLVFLLPPLDRQVAIAKMLDDLKMRKNRIAHQIGREVDLLKRQKQSLIFAAVTGQIDVRNYHPQEAAADQ